MLIDARQLAPEETLRCDVCIVGAGPAGITIARELASQGRSVVLLESGGIGLEAAAEDLNKGEVVDPVTHGALEAYRRRRVGGASTSWGGRCVPFDDIDYERRAWVPNSGWPFGKSLVDPYSKRAHAYLDLGAYAYDVKDALPSAAAAKPMIPGLARAGGSDDVTADGLYLFSPPTNFAKKYLDELTASPRVRLCLHANCLEVVTDPDGGAVSHLAVASRGDGADAGLHRGLRSTESSSAPGPAAQRRFSVVADRYVLAAGGLENVRLLLASDRVHANGIGNHRDRLGRYYMCHVIGRCEVEFASSEVVWDYEMTTSGRYCQRTLAVKPDAQRRLGLLNHRARIEHADISNPVHGSGVLSAAFLVKSILASPLLRARLDVLSRGVLSSTQKGELRLAEHLRNILLDAGGVARFSRRWLFERILSHVKLPSVVMRSDANVYTLRVDAEQIPNPDSRVTLGHERDAFGQRRLKVDWRRTSTDDELLLEACKLMGRALEASGAGRLRSEPVLVPEATGGHHIGTTRMSTDPAAGVVDENCRVHDVKNLYIASSSVFPTCSYANPTLVVLSLSLRLADHLQKSVRPVPQLHVVDGAEQAPRQEA